MSAVRSQARIAHCRRIVRGRLTTVIHNPGTLIQLPLDLSAWEPFDRQRIVSGSAGKTGWRAAG